MPYGAEGFHIIMAEQQASAETTNTEEGTDSEKDIAAVETVDPVKHKQLADAHAQQGRELKAAREAVSKAEQKASELEAEREQARYERMNEEQKAEYRRTQEVKSLEAPKTANLRNEKDLLRIIASTDDPKITKALSKLYYRSEERGKFPDKDDVEALIEGLQSDDDEETETKTEEKKPPKVTAVGGTRAKEPTADEEVAAISASLKAKDGKFVYGDLLVARQRRDAQRAQASKG